MKQKKGKHSPQNQASSAVRLKILISRVICETIMALTKIHKTIHGRISIASGPDPPKVEFS
jgi:hypothetical protein